MPSRLPSGALLPIPATTPPPSAWQAYDSAAVRVSVDDHMLLLRERGRNVAPGACCRLGTRMDRAPCHRAGVKCLTAVGVALSRS